MTQPKRFHDPLDDFLDQPIAYNPAWKRITKSAVGAILFSQAWYWSKRHQDSDGWFFKTQKEWQEETGLSRHEQDTARKHCVKAGVLQVELKGVPATLHYHVDRKKVYEKLGIQFAALRQTGLPQPDKQVRGVAANINKVIETPPEIPLYDNDELINRTSIFASLYQSNITMITPLIADAIQDAVIEYPDVSWYRPVFEIAVKNNARNLNYILAVLKGWKEHHFGWAPQFKKNGKTNGVNGQTAAEILAGSRSTT